MARLLSCLLLLGGLVQSCSKPNSVLLVNVVDDSGALTAVTQLKVRVLVGTAVSQFSVPTAPGGPITFPTSFTVEINRSNSGAVNVNVMAMSGSKTVSGTANLGMLDVGKENVVTVHLGFPPPPDAGVDSGGIDAGVDAAADRGSDAPSDAGARDVGSDVPTISAPTCRSTGTAPAVRARVEWGWAAWGWAGWGWAEWGPAEWGSAEWGRAEWEPAEWGPAARVWGGTWEWAATWAPPATPAPTPRTPAMPPTPATRATRATPTTHPRSRALALCAARPGGSPAAARTMG